MVFNLETGLEARFGLEVSRREEFPFRCDLTVSCLSR